MNPKRIEIRANRRMALRALVPHCIVAGCAIIGGRILARDDPEAPAALAYIAAFVVLVGAVRAGSWLLSAGSTRLWIEGENVAISSALRRPVIVDRSSVQNLEILQGSRRPEWARWAILPTLVVTAEMDERVVKVRRKFLVSWDLIDGTERKAREILGMTPRRDGSSRYED
jgi:hypothetical protein